MVRTTIVQRLSSLSLLLVDLKFDDGLRADTRLRRMRSARAETVMTIVVVARLPSTVEARMNHALVERLNVFRDVASAVLLVVILCAKTAIIGAVDRKIAPNL